MAIKGQDAFVVLQLPGEVFVLRRGDSRINRCDMSWPVGVPGPHGLEHVQWNILALYHHLTHVHDVPPAKVHEQLLQIDEYVEFLAA